MVVAQPKGEAEVVADCEQETDAAPQDHHFVVSGAVAKSLAARGIEVMLVVVVDVALGGDEVTTVRPLGCRWERIVIYGKTATQGGAVFLRQGKQLLFNGRSAFQLTFRWKRNKARSAHFWQYEQVSIGAILQHPFNLLVVGVWVEPSNILLEKGDFHRITTLRLVPSCLTMYTPLGSLSN